MASKPVIGTVVPATGTAVLPYEPVNIRHSKATPRWGSPADLVARGRRTMGGLDLDPASEEKFNKVVQAPKYYSWEERQEDGLLLPWAGKIWLNPPGGLVKEFWNRLFTEDGVEQAIFVGFSMEQLGLLANEAVHPSDFSILFCRKRISFSRHDDYEGSPAHANYVCGVNVNHDAFVREFGSMGKIQKGPYAK